jgi:hypothetical protein
MANTCMRLANRISRRWFVLSGTALAFTKGFAQPKNETVYRFATPKWNVLMTVEFHDRYASSGFWFEERRTNRQYCLSAAGKQDSNCLENFTGSVAIARFQVKARYRKDTLNVLREHVRTIDQDHRLNARAPFERLIQLQQGVASDIQAFGYEVKTSASVPTIRDERYGPWCLLRQDLYLDDQSSPFLVVHWKHALNAIRILDIIPGDETRAINI